MNRNYVFRNTTEALPALMSDLMAHGAEVGSRNGRTKELDMISITLTAPTERVLQVPNRKNNIAAQIAETMWVLAGRDDVEWLSRYLPRATDYSDDGEVWRGAYGPRIRSWNDKVDQLAYVIDTLKEHSLSRQAVMAIYDPAVDTQSGKDIPCNDFIMFSNRNGRIDMHVTIRSNDAIWGWSGINVFEWSMIQEVVARCVGVGVGSLHFSISSFHVYDQHWDRATLISKESPSNAGTNVLFRPEVIGLPEPGHIDWLIREWFRVEELIRTRNPDAVTEIENFPEPLWQTWLYVIKWWWTGDKKHLGDTDVAYGVQYSVQPDVDLVQEPDRDLVGFIDSVHREKGAAYGVSWKKRGEMLSILANIARKVDRLLVGGKTSDETMFDTAMDTLVYLAKYRWWLTEEAGAPSPVELRGHAEEYTEVRELLEALEFTINLHEPPTVEQLAYLLDRNLEIVTDMATVGDRNRYFIVDTMLREAWLATSILWESR